MVTYLLSLTVVKRFYGHIPLVDLGLLTEYLQKAPGIVQKAFLFKCLSQLVIVDGVAQEFSSELYQVEQQGLTMDLADYLHQIVGFISFIFAYLIFERCGLDIVIGEIGTSIVVDAVWRG